MKAEGTRPSLRGYDRGPFQNSLLTNPLLSSFSLTVGLCVRGILMTSFAISYDGWNGFPQPGTHPGSQGTSRCSSRICTHADTPKPASLILAPKPLTHMILPTKLIQFLKRRALKPERFPPHPTTPHKPQRV